MVDDGRRTVLRLSIRRKQLLLREEIKGRLMERRLPLYSPLSLLSVKATPYMVVQYMWRIKGKHPYFH